MSQSPFADDAAGYRMPDAISGLISKTTINTMEIGEETWLTPWSITIFTDGTMAVRAHSEGDRHETSGGTLQLKLIRDRNGVYLDATALSPEDVSRNFSVTDKFSDRFFDADAELRVLGVLWPEFDDFNGLNFQQIAIRDQFGAYFKETFGCAYSFAMDEYY